MMSSQQEILSFLSEKKSYPHKVTRIRIKETHISWVFLAGNYVYKVKKELKFGDILDFSTLARRKKYCIREVQINKILCSDMYIDTVKIVRKHGIMEIVGLHRGGRSLEYAVKMMQMPQECLMDKLLLNDRIHKNDIDRLVCVLVNFHNSTPTNVKIKSFGRPEMLLKVIKENFVTLGKLARPNLLLEQKLVSFIYNNKKLFYQRMKENKIRDIHGDLGLQNIFIVRNKIYLYDRIEFNDVLRYADVAHDVAHLAMDLGFYGRHDLQEYFISRYIEKSGDKDLSKIINFLMSFKASMRAKVSYFRAQSEPDDEKRKLQISESEKRLELAEFYMNRF